MAHFKVIDNMGESTVWTVVLKKGAMTGPYIGLAYLHIFMSFTYLRTNHREGTNIFKPPPPPQNKQTNKQNRLLNRLLTIKKEIASSIASSQTNKQKSPPQSPPQ